MAQAARRRAAESVSTAGTLSVPLEFRHAARIADQMQYYRPIPLAEDGLDRMKVRDVIRLLEQNGWHHVATRGSHRQFKHPSRPGRVTVAGKMSDDLAPGTLNSILKQADLKDNE